MMAWSAKAGQAYLSKDGIRQIKSKLTNDIFRNEMLHLYEQKSESRDELVRQARRAMLELVRAMQDARNQFTQMMENVNQILRFIITGETEESGGCSGSCESCGGCSSCGGCH